MQNTKGVVIMNRNNQNFSKIPYRDIKVTLHAKQRASERLGINKESEIQKLAHAAKYKGVKILALTTENYDEFGITYDMYRYLKNRYTHRYKSDKIYYYRDHVFVFAGDRSRCLKSIVPCYEEDMKKAIAKLDGIPYEEVSA